MNDKELVANVIDELFWDPKISTESIAVTTDDGVVTLRGTVARSEERRVGKECRSRWSPYH